MADQAQTKTEVVKEPAVAGADAENVVAPIKAKTEHAFAAEVKKPFEGKVPFKLGSGKLRIKGTDELHTAGAIVELTYSQFQAFKDLVL